jgi:2-amino-4-hydroxy-6-hydroxymethyldihydropteridine diphosphokinase
VNTVIVGIGSNIDPDHHIDLAIGKLSVFSRVLQVSSLRETAPVGYAEQPDFVNGAVLVETDQDTGGFTRTLKTIEQDLGRVKTSNKNGPHTIDLDIVVWNGRVVDDDYYKRDFLRESVREVGGP